MSSAWEIDGRWKKAIRFADAIEVYGPGVAEEMKDEHWEFMTRRINDEEEELAIQSGKRKQDAHHYGVPSKECRNMIIARLQKRFANRESWKTEGLAKRPRYRRGSREVRLRIARRGGVQ